MSQWLWGRARMGMSFSHLGVLAAISEYCGLCAIVCKQVLLIWPCLIHLCISQTRERRLSILLTLLILSQTGRKRVSARSPVNNTAHFFITTFLLAVADVNFGYIIFLKVEICACDSATGFCSFLGLLLLWGFNDCRHPKHCIPSKSFSVSIDFKAGGGWVGGLVRWCVRRGVKWAVIKVMSLVCTNQN